MGTSYAGYNPFTFAAQPASYGRFISGLAADDDDLDDAAHLMALPMASMDDVQFLAWRTLDIISGANYTSAVYLAATINLGTRMWFQNPTECGVGASGVWFNKGLEYVTGWSSSKSMQVGHSSVGAGLLKVRTGSAIIANGGSKADATLYADGDLRGSDAVIAADGANARLHISQDASGTFRGSTAHGLPFNVSQAGTSATFYHPIKQSGNDGYHVRRQYLANYGAGFSAANITVSNPEKYDTIRCTRCGAIGSPSVVVTLTLGDPDASVPDGVRLVVYVGQGVDLGAAGYTDGVLSVIAHGVTYSKPITLNGTGQYTEYATRLEFEVYGGEWVAVG